MTVLSLAQSAARRIGEPAPNVLMTATDATALLLRELAQEEGQQLARYGDWRILRKEHTFTTTATETQTDTPVPADLAGFIDGTVWNRNARRPLYGPVDPVQWQAWKATVAFPVTDSFTLRGSLWLMQPVPAAGQTIAYEYRSDQWCQSSGAVAQSVWMADTDTGLLSERLMSLGIVWRYKQNRGLDWQTDYDKYAYEVEQELAKDRPRKVVDLRNGGPPQRYPGIAVPEGDWSVS